MSNPADVDVVRALYAAFLSGDVDALLNLLTEDVTFVLPKMPGVPMGSEFHGKEGVRRFLAERGPVLTYTAFEPRRFFSDQDHVIVLGATAGTVNASGKPFGYDWVQLFEISRVGRVRRFHEFMDTHVLVSAFA